MVCCVINNLKKIFVRFGVFDEVVSDNGLQYSNIRNLFSIIYEFKQFVEEWGFCYIISFLEYFQLNGVVERVVQIVKCIFKKVVVDKKDFFEGLLKYCNIFFEDIGVLFVQLLMSWCICMMIFIY